jgi:polyketide synthase 12/myxalamid-type polyketide synthase MxaB
VIHAAGVLDDGVLAQQTWARCATVFGPKVGGAWALDRATAGLPLDWFVLFSSMVTVVGAPGQGNYAAANAALDALAHQRRARGQSGLSINWGPWADAGMSAGVSDLDRQRWQRQGISFIKGPQGLGLMGQLLADRRTDAAQIAVLPIQWPVLLRQFPPGAEPLLFAELARQVGPVAGRPAAATTGPSLVDQLQQAAPMKRRAIAVAQVSDLARRVLGLEPSTSIDVGRPLQEFGLDSLMAVELRNTLGSALNRTLPATLLFKYPTVQALADFTLESLKLDDAPIVEAVIAAGDAPDVVEVGTLSDDEVKRMLAEELASLSSADWAGGDHGDV